MMAKEYLVLEIEEITGLDANRRPMILFRVRAETTGKTRFHIDVPEEQADAATVAMLLQARAKQLDSLLKL